MKRAHNKNGFSLVQVSILLLVASIVMVSLLPGGTLGSDAEKARITKERMQKIEDATRGFMAKNLRRPCPADGSIAPGTADFGIEAATQGSCTGSPAANFVGYDTTYSATTTSNSNIVTGLSSTSALSPGMIVSGSSITAGSMIVSVDSSSQITLNKYVTAGAADTLTFYNVVAGVVPTHTLGLSDEYMLDGWGRRLMYFVDSGATRSDSCRDKQGTGMVGNLKLTTAFSTATAKDNAMWALVSYGKDGHGAFPANGSTIANRFDAKTPASTTADNNTLFNASVNAGFASTYGTSNGYNYYGHALVSTDPSSGFDDIVWTLDSTKNTCCIGKWCSYGLRLNGSASSTDSTLYAIGGTSGSPTTGPLGAALASGDINGDGIQDLVIGQSSASANTGKIYVLFGTKAGMPVLNSPLTLSTGLNGRNGFTIANSCSSSIVGYMGRTLAVGDVDGDGYDDIVASGTTGLVVVYGKSSFSATPSIDVNTLQASTNGFIIAHGSSTGGPIALGDVNGDKVMDIITSGGAASAAVSSSYTLGTSYAWAIFGRTKTRWGVLIPNAVASCGGSNISNWGLSGLATWSTADVIKIQGVNTNKTACAAPNGTTTINTTTLAMTSTGGFPGQAMVGATITGAGIQAGTTIAAIPNNTQITLSQKATSTATANITISGLTSTPHYFIHSYNAIAAGDLNGDGIDDIALGASYNSGFTPYVYVIFGRISAAATYTNLGTSTALTSPVPTWDDSIYTTNNGITPAICAYVDYGKTFTTPSGYYRAVRFLGTASYGIGKIVKIADIGDAAASDQLGIKDLIIGAHSGASAGVVYVYFGRTSTTTNWQTAQYTLSTAANYKITSTSPTNVTGQIPLSITTGDVNNDGRNDLLLGTFQSTVGGNANTGSIWAMFQPYNGWTTGMASPTTMFSATNWFNSVTGLPYTSARGFRIDGPSGGYAYISATGDFNGDGKTDIAVASPASNGNAGYIYVLWGKTTVPWSSTVTEKLSDIQ